MPKRKLSTASQILRRRYVRDEQRQHSLELERANAEIARNIAALRQEAGLTQAELAKRVRTTQSVISRLEDADYDGHSLSMLHRIADALGKKLTISMESRDSDLRSVRTAFREVVRRLRVSHGYTVQDVADRLGISSSEAVSLERDDSFRPSPLLLHRISKMYDIPQRQLALLCGAIRDVPQPIRERASRFAAMSDSFSNLTDEEKKELDIFVNFLRSEV